MWVITRGLHDHNVCIDPISSELYKHIFLLNVNHKLVIVKRSEGLNGFLANLIHPDQNGFVPMKYIRDNNGYSLNDVYMKMTMIFLDVEKNFDNFERSFVKKMKVYYMDTDYLQWTRSQDNGKWIDITNCIIIPSNNCRRIHITKCFMMKGI